MPSPQTAARGSKGVLDEQGRCCRVFYALALEAHCHFCDSVRVEVIVGPLPGYKLCPSEGEVSEILGHVS